MPAESRHGVYSDMPAATSRHAVPARRFTSWVEWIAFALLLSNLPQLGDLSRLWPLVAALGIAWLSPLMVIRQDSHPWLTPRPGAKALGRAKRSFDVAGSLVLLTLTAPLMLVIAALVVVEDGGPALFRQRRVGRDGQQFWCLKFRSMVVDAESRLEDLQRSAELVVLFKLQRDPRVTRIGALLRRHSLDELPQLWNVLRGDMSLVGPRPCLPVELQAFRGVAPQRLRVRPGMTGLWQVSGRSDLSFDQGAVLDRQYVDNWSFLSDLVILVRTVSAVIAPRGAY